LQHEGTLSDSPIRHQIAAVSVGVYRGVPVLDLDYAEDSNAETDMNVVMDGDGGLIEIQGTAEDKAFSRAELNALLDLAGAGIEQILAAQRNALAA
jgi:ribonuclease PH